MTTTQLTERLCTLDQGLSAIGEIINGDALPSHVAKLIKADVSTKIVALLTTLQVSLLLAEFLEIERDHAIQLLASQIHIKS